MSVKALGRLTALDGQPTMKAVVTMGNGGYDQLIYCDVARPTPGQSEVLVQVPCKIVSASQTPIKEPSSLLAG